MSHHEQHPRKDGEQDGSALVLAVFVLALLTAMGAALLFLSQTEVKAGEASIRPKKAFYYAEAGLEHARHALWLSNNTDEFKDDLQFATGSTSLTDPIGYTPDTLAPVYDTSGNVIGFNGYGNDNPLVGVTQFEDGWYAAFMSNDHGEKRKNPSDTDDRIILTGVGVGPDQTMEVVEAVIDIDPFLPEMPPAAIFLIGPTPKLDTGTAAGKNYNGNDCGVSGGDYYPVVGTIGTGAEAAAEAGAASGPNYETGPYNTASDVIADMTTTPVQGMSDTTYSMDSDWGNCLAMKELVEGLRVIADVTCADSTKLAKPSCPADVSDIQNIYFGEGDLEVSKNSHHYGTLVVTGELALSGGIDFDGVILVIGEGSVIPAGSGNGTVSGGIVVANIAGPDGIYGNSDDCTGGDKGFFPTSFNQNGGGNSDTVYCSDALKAADHAKPYEIREFRQY